MTKHDILTQVSALISFRPISRFRVLSFDESEGKFLKFSDNQNFYYHLKTKSIIISNVRETSLGTIYSVFH